MSGSDWRDDDDALDDLIRGLGTPEAAAPVASAAEILARAGVVAPVVTGLAGWKLAAALSLAVGGGFGLGLYFADGRDGGETVAAVGTETGAGVTTGSTAAPVSSAPEIAPAEAASSGAEAGLGPALASRTEPSSNAPEPSLSATSTPSASCPEPTPEGPTYEDLSELLTSGPLASAAQASGPSASQDSPAPAERSSPREEPADTADTAEIARADGPSRLGARIGVGPMLAPSRTLGLQTAAALLRNPAADDDRGWVFGPGLGLGMFNGRSGASWTVDLGGELSRAWRLGRAEIDVGWTLGGRLIVPAQKGAGGADPAGQVPVGAEELAALDHPRVLPATGPQLGLSLGDAGSSRLNLALNAQVTPSVTGWVPWVSLSVGGTFGDLLSGSKKSG